MDRVFTMARNNHKGDRYTEFGFEAAGRKYYAVEVPGWPQIEAGMTVTALLERQDDWGSVCGWVNRQTGEITAPATGQWFFMLAGSTLMVVATAASWRDAEALLLLIPVWLICLLHIVPRRKIRRALDTLSKE
ncbi:hypothetical protein [Duganella sp. Root1480D1]|uniref:hypothetical protein n=1 Tax=Duganella sp. Root1480D1 TaxID=1736471 RepID=UPI00070EBD02|nr:hypothetical protein [Duganella sp. Root1480D1]KQZ42288.1 hypothetical protein ASD58_25835 [Duganella sp. Root1480D1]